MLNIIICNPNFSKTVVGRATDLTRGAPAKKYRSTVRTVETVGTHRTGRVVLTGQAVPGR